MKRTALALMLLASACSKPPEEPKDVRSKFEFMVQGIGWEEPCSRIIPAEWGPSMPVPAVRDGKLTYRVFFYGWSGSPSAGIRINDAQGDAEFSPEGKVLSCTRRTGPKRDFPDDAAPATEGKARPHRVSELYPSIEEMGRLFARGAPVLDQNRARLAAFSTEFAELAFPGHAAAYRALSPDFWTWVEKNGGVPPAK